MITEGRPGGILVRLAGTSSVFHDRCLIGRGTDCDLVLDDEKASRWHAMLIPREDGWHVEDMGSISGVRVNGTVRARARLTQGDKLVLGRTELVVVPF